MKSRAMTDNGRGRYNFYEFNGLDMNIENYPYKLITWFLVPKVTDKKKTYAAFRGGKNRIGFQGYIFETIENVYEIEGYYVSRLVLHMYNHDRMIEICHMLAALLKRNRLWLGGKVGPRESAVLEEFHNLKLEDLI